MTQSEGCGSTDVLIEGPDGGVATLSSLGDRPHIRLAVGESMRVTASGRCAGRIGAGPRGASGPLSSQDGVLFEALEPGSLEIVVYTAQRSGDGSMERARQLVVIGRVEVVVVDARQAIHPQDAKRS